MLGTLTEKMQGLLSKIAGKKKLTEDNISEAVSEVRLALLEADVNYSVTKTLVKQLKEKAGGPLAHLSYWQRRCCNCRIADFEPIRVAVAHDRQLTGNMNF